jgi:D-alanyl-D-alanine carboxypeptidase/D-alanyl-D-alanine-endopeptidase (penicillin-binding protein 4)
VLVVSLDTGDTLFARSPDSLVAPASNMKLLTTTAALERLGPDYRFHTYLVTDGTVENGVLHGDLVLFGTGDPGISDRFYPSKVEVFEQLVDKLEARGIRRITGDLVGDASYFSGPLRPRGWDPRDLNDHFAPAISALQFNENVVSFRVEAAPRAGAHPTVMTIPDHAGLDIVNDALTVTGRARPRLAILRDRPLDPIRVEGRIRTGSRDVWRQMTVPRPSEFALSVFRSVLQERGIEVQGDNRIVTTPGGSLLTGPRVVAPARQGSPHVHTLAVHASPPLREYLALINKKSNNLFAESVFRTLGRVTEGVSTPDASARAVADALHELGVSTRDVVQLDGSGLSAGNRVNASTLVDILTHLSRSPLWKQFWATLPEAGRPRELRRMYHTRAARNLRAKTGTIDHVSALTGMVRSADGERLVFSILVNGTPSTARAKGVENRIGARLASFSRGFQPPETLEEATDVATLADETTQSSRRYRVRRGETFSLIAKRNGLTLDELLNANPRVEPRGLRAGQTILIPNGN